MGIFSFSYSLPEWRWRGPAVFVYLGTMKCNFCDPGSVESERLREQRLLFDAPLVLHKRNLFLLIFFLPNQRVEKLG